MSTIMRASGAQGSILFCTGVCRVVVYRHPWQEPPRLRLLGSQSPKASREPTPLLRLLRSHSPAAPEEPTALGSSSGAVGAGPAPQEPR